MDLSLPPTDLAGYNPLTHAGSCWWDAEEAARACDFFPRMLKHVEGPKAGEPLTLEPWQQAYVATLFGWKRENGIRRYRESIAAIPRKSGKTTLAAGIALYCLVCDGEAGAQVYSAAYSKDQASLVYRIAAGMVQRSPKLSKHLHAIDSVKRIIFKKSGSFYRAIPAEAGNSHGFNASAVIFDELHTQKHRDLYDVLRSSQGARKQPLFLSITTAGFDRHSVCYEVWNHARQVRDGILPDPHFLPLLFETPDDADWTAEDVWRQANPNLGVSVSVEFLRDECQRAKDSPAYENTFRNLYLNQWVEQATRWLSMEKWRACGVEEVPELDGEPCFCGLDLSTRSDITALAMLFPREEGGYWLKMRFWVPQEQARSRERRDGVPYSQWIKDGWITATEGDRVDYAVVRRDLNQLANHFSIQELAIDPWNATQLTNELTQDGFDIVEFRQGFASMSPAAKELDAAVATGTLQHGGNPVLDWMAANVAVEQDAAGNIKPSKRKSTERIDGIVAATMAIGRASQQAAQQWFYSSNPMEIG